MKLSKEFQRWGLTKKDFKNVYLSPKGALYKTKINMEKLCKRFYNEE